MQTRLNWPLLITTMICICILLVSIYPGVLQNFLVAMVLILTGFFWLIAIGCILLQLLWSLWQERQSADWPRSLLTKSLLSRIGLLLMILIGSYGLLKFYVPRRIAFAGARPAFDRWLQANPPQVSDQQSQNSLRSINLQFGPYKVDQYAIDQRGGQYFRVYSHGDGLGPDTVSYGFAHQPNLEGSPFGSAYYEIHPLGKGWFWFQASNDW